MALLDVLGVLIGRGVLLLRPPQAATLRIGSGTAGRLFVMATLNKSDLAGLVATETDLNNSQAKLAIEKTFELIARCIAAGHDVNVTGFGKFSTSERSARQGRNPQTGETIEIAATTAPKFSAASQLKTAVRGR
jgi:DNA-binding protein HU-beta